MIDAGADKPDPLRHAVDGHVGDYTLAIEEAFDHAASGNGALRHALGRLSVSLTPLEVKKQEFEKVFRGYDPVAVDAFLELVSEEMAALVASQRSRGTVDRRAVDGGGLSTDGAGSQGDRGKRSAPGGRRPGDCGEGRRDRRPGSRLSPGRLVAEAERRRASLEERIQEMESSERDFLRRLKAFLDEHRRTLEAHPLLLDVGKARNVQAGGA